MKKIVRKKIFALLILVAISNSIINLFFYNGKLPYYWGSKEIMDKRNYLIKNNSKFNTLFIGSSKTHYQIMPVLFDSLVNNSCKCGIHSFNFGIDGMLPPESFYIYKSLLENDSLSIKNIFIELDFIESASTRNLSAWRSYYWLNNETYHEYTSSYLDSKYGLSLKVWNMAVLNYWAIENIYNIGKFNEYVGFKKNVSDGSVYKEKETAGFAALSHPKLFKPKEISDINDVENSSKTAYSNFAKWTSGSKNEAYLRSLNEIIDLSRKKGIRLIFIFPIQWKLYQYKELFPIMNTIPQNRKISLADYQSHKPLFEINNLNDDAHLNGVGAKIYTTYLANAFIKIN